LRLAVASAFLVDGARGNFLRDIVLSAALLQALLDMLVLAFALVAPLRLWHVFLPSACGPRATLIPVRATGTVDVRGERRMASAGLEIAVPAPYRRGAEPEPSRPSTMSDR